MDTVGYTEVYGKSSQFLSQLPGAVNVQIILYPVSNAFIRAYQKRLIFLDIQPSRSHYSAAPGGERRIEEFRVDLVHDDGGFLLKPFREPLHSLPGLEHAAVGQRQQKLTDETADPPGILKLRIVSDRDYAPGWKTHCGQY